MKSSEMCFIVFKIYLCVLPCGHNLFLSIAELYSIVWIHLVVSAIPSFFITRNKTSMAVLARGSRWGILHVQIVHGHRIRKESLDRRACTTVSLTSRCPCSCPYFFFGEVN